jgi:putative tricarboxylic transport membrane protein
MRAVTQAELMNLRSSTAGDVIAGTLLAALGIYIVTTAYGWSFLSPSGPGPGFFPSIYGSLIVALSLWLAIKAALKAPDGAGAGWIPSRRSLAMWGTFVAAILLIPVLGFYLAFALTTLFVATAFFGKSVTTGLIAGASVSAGFFLIFSEAFGVPLPQGLLGF